jgi:ferredoxin
MKIRTDTESCVGAGQCVLVGPRVFDIDDDGKVVVLDDNPAPELHDEVREAAAACPSFAIEFDE